MMDAQVSPNATQVHPIHIQLQGLLAHVFWIASRFGLWRVFALTVHAQIPLGTQFGFSGSVLPRGLLTFRTGLHSSILTQKSIHSRCVLELYLSFRKKIKKGLDHPVECGFHLTNDRRPSHGNCTHR